MKILLLCLILLLAGPATEPVTESLLDGQITYTPGEQWKLQGKSDNDRLAAYSRSDPRAQLAVNVDPQSQVLDDSAAIKIGQMLCKRIRDTAAGDATEQTLLAPRVEKDDRFFLRIHYRFKRGAETGDQLQLYRVIGKNLLAVATTAFTDSPEKSAVVFGEAESMILSIKGGGERAVVRVHPATQPIFLSRAKVRISPPVGWAQELSDTDSGIAAKFRDSGAKDSFIALIVTPIPPDARTNPKLREPLLDKIVSDEKEQFKIEGATPAGEAQALPDRRFLRKQKTALVAKEKHFELISRQLRIGDLLVSVVMLCPADAAAANDRLADDVAMTVRPMGK